MTDKGIAKIAQLNQLKNISLKGTHVTNNGIIQLTNLNLLNWIDLRETKVTKDGVKKLIESFPKCIVLTND
jgi:hypothetical protein